MRSITMRMSRAYARYADFVLSLLDRPDASCSAAIAEAAVTPELVAPLLTSVLPVVHFSSSILFCKIVM